MNVSIVLTRYAEPNWLLAETLQSLSKQQGVKGEVLLLDQIEDQEAKVLSASLSSEGMCFRYLRIAQRGLSFARNQGIAHAQHSVVLFIDSDAIADRHWALNLATHLQANQVAVVGSRIVPKWHRPPLLISRSRIVLDQYSVFDFGVATRDCSRVVGAGFGLDKGSTGEQCYFNEAYGRRNGRLIGGEESDLCRRVQAAGGTIRYVGQSLIEHQILEERIKYKWILKRIYFAGFTRALSGGSPRPTHRLSISDYLTLPLILPVYGAGYLWGILSGS